MYAFPPIFIATRKEKYLQQEKKLKNLLQVYEKALPLHRNSEQGVLARNAEIKLGYGVIGNTTDSGPVILGSSPGIPTTRK